MENCKIAIIGLGYVGLPLAAAFAEKYLVVGFDINKQRIEEISILKDNTKEISSLELKNILIPKIEKFEKGLFISNEQNYLLECNIFIITVPTPINKFNQPDLSPSISATTMIGKVLKKGDIVIYESTVYPGVTEDELAPLLSKVSGLKYNIDFFCGYSPERINPGDKQRTVKNILKVTSGSTKEIATLIDKLYKSIIVAGTFKAKSIKIAEASKVIENCQRDINIAFVYELSKIFQLLNIDTLDVLETASTKWNFLNFKPGLVGGHCIGVDPYYLAQKAQELGYNPEIILSGRRINNSMGKYIANQVIKYLLKKSYTLVNAKVLILGFTFKENCPDVRNTKVIDIYTELTDFGVFIDVHDPRANPTDVLNEYGINLVELSNTKYSAIILAVSHSEFNSFDLRNYLKEDGIVYDVKGALPRDLVDARL